MKFNHGKTLTYMAGETSQWSCSKSAVSNVLIWASWALFSVSSCTFIVVFYVISLWSNDQSSKTFPLASKGQRLQHVILFFLLHILSPCCTNTNRNKLTEMWFLQYGAWIHPPVSPDIHFNSPSFSSLYKHTDQSYVSKETSSVTFLSPTQINVGLFERKPGVVAIGPFKD